MNLLVGMFAGAVLVSGVCACGVVIGRQGTSNLHRTAFVSGLSGLVAVPLWFLGLIGLVSQLFWAEVTSPSGILFMATSAVMLFASVCVIQAWVRLRIRPLRS